MSDRTAYERPVQAKLVVRLENGEEWEATSADFEKFNLVDRHDAYMEFDRQFGNILRDAELVGRDITDAALNPLRYLVEIAIAHPQMLVTHADELSEDWARVAEIERTLKAAEAHR